MPNKAASIELAVAACRLPPEQATSSLCPWVGPSGQSESVPVQPAAPSHFFRKPIFTVRTSRPASLRGDG
jgi:hypothetical protein